MEIIIIIILLYLCMPIMRKNVYVCTNIIMNISHGYALEITNNSVIIIKSKP